MKKMLKKMLVFIGVIVIIGISYFILFTNKKEVTITSEDKEKYYRNVSIYLNDVVFKMNDGVEFKYKSSDTMLFIPAGNKITCVSDNILGSPFSNSWKYIYVGVYYNGEEYLYSVAAKDGEDYEMELMTQKELFSCDYSIIKKSHINISEFTDNYNENLKENKVYSLDDISKPLKEFINDNYKDVKKIIFITPKECSYE